MTAKEAALQLGVSVRTVKRIVAEPRAEFEARGKARRDQAAELRATGLKYREIAETMGTTIGSVGRLIHDAKQLAVAPAPTAKKHRTQQTA